MHSGNIVIQVIFKTVYAHIAQFEKYRKPLYVPTQWLPFSFPQR